jgi:hypothetical protein
MKGIVVNCLEKLVSESFGTEKWKEIMSLSGVSADKKYEIADDIEDELVLKMFANTCQVGNLSFEQACDVFGEYWVSSYIPRLYPDFYVDVKSAKEFLLKLDTIHASISTRIKNAKPPRHSYEWKDENTLAMSYLSDRDLIELFVGAIKGVANHFNEDIQIRKVDRQSVEINFSSSL